MRLNEHPVSTRNYQRAKSLRREASPCEQKLWPVLSESARQQGLKFRRQQPIHPYTVDFACMSAKLVVELDGWSHDARQEQDKARDEYLHSLGYHVLRFADDEVMSNLEGVVLTILAAAQSRKPDKSPASRPLPNPSLKGEGLSKVHRS